MKNNETNITDRSRPYPDGSCCYCIQVLLSKLSCSHQEKNKHTIRYHSHVNMDSGCLVRRHILGLHWLASYNGSRQVVAGLCRVLYWVQLLEVLFVLTCACKKDVTTHGEYIKYSHNVYIQICKMSYGLSPVYYSESLYCRL